MVNNTDPAQIEWLLALPEGVLTAQQRLAAELVLEHGSGWAASRARGLNADWAKKLVNRALRNAARLGHAPGHWDEASAPGYYVHAAKIRRNKGGDVVGSSVEQRLDADDGMRRLTQGIDTALAGTHRLGKVTVNRTDAGVRQVWERHEPDAAAREAALKAAIAAMAEAIPPAEPVAPAGHTHADLLTLYTFTDFHLGMLAWHREGGDDWDTAIAETVGRRAMAALVEGAPPSRQAIVNIQGDFLHTDGLEPLTPASKHVLDADSRFGKVVTVAIRLIRELMRLALGRHERVTLIIMEGNHDPVSSIWLRNLFSALYEGEPRASVHDTELPYAAIRHGTTLLGFHHGHMKKNDDLPALFAQQFRTMWGECARTIIHTGHRHHRETKEHAGAEVVQHPTLAARDAYAARGGWHAQRRITAITYHAAHGEVGTTTITPEMLQ